MCSVNLLTPNNDFTNTGLDTSVLNQSKPPIEVTSYTPDANLVKKAFARPSVAGAQAILDATAERLYERMDLLKDKPSRVIDLGTGDGRHLSVLSKRFPDAVLIGADLSLSRLQQTQSGRFSGSVWRHLLQRLLKQQPMRVCLDAAGGLPFCDASFDLLVSNMLLPWVFDAQQLMSEINRLLTTDGAFFISAAGPDTLIELRNAWSAVDDCSHINAFMDMHDLGDLLAGAGIADPVLDTERITVTYPTLAALLKDLTGLGFINVLGGRRKGLTSASVTDRLAASYPQNADGGIDATLELVVAHGWCGNPRASSGADEFYFPIDQLKKHR